MNKPLGDMERLRTLVNESEFDAVVAVSPENVFYTCGVVIGTQTSIRERLALTVIPKQGDPVLIVCNIEEPQTRAESFIKDIRAYFEFKQSPIALLAIVLGELGCGSGKVGIETHYLSANYWKELEAALPAAAFGSCDSLFDRARVVKTPAEIALLVKAARSTEKALLATYAGIQEGDNEFDLVERLSSNLFRSGAQKINFAYINVGPNTGYPHSHPTAYQGVAGDLIKTDCGGFYNGYISDVARTAVLGKASPEQLSIYSRLLEIHDACVALARTGTRPSDIYATMVREHERVGIHFGLTHAGHSVGITGHEQPILNPYNTEGLEANTMLYIETRVRWPGKAGYHIEDLIQVTDDGPVVHTGYFDIRNLMEV